MIKDKASIAILCGGKGLRLRPITADIPKPLIKIGTKPILQHIITHFKKFDHKEYFIATGYKSNKIEKFMQDKFNSINYTIIDSGDVQILQRIRDILNHHSGENDIILCYGDTISDVDTNKLTKFHYNDINSLTITSYPISIPFGVMNIGQDNKVKSFIEKPVLKEVMNIGYFYISNILFDKFYKYESFEDVLINLTKEKKLKCYQHNGIHITVNTIKELEYANENITKIFK